MPGYDATNRMADVGTVRTSPGIASVTPRTAEILDSRRLHRPVRRRGWIVRRTLLAADVCGLLLAFTLAELLFGLHPEGHDRVSLPSEIIVFALTIPGWILTAKLLGLYENDETRTNHSTADEITSVFHLVTTGVWIFVVTAWLSGRANVDPTRVIAFWAMAYVAVLGGRLIARAICRHTLAYQQNTLIVGAGNIGQLVARKIQHHPEYGLNVVGFVDSHPRERRADIADVPVLGQPDRLADMIREFDVDRVVVAFSGDSDMAQLQLVRAVRDMPVQIDIVPRVFELVGPNAGVHTIEGLTLIGLPPLHIGRTSRWIKRSIDIVGATIGLVVFAPVFLWAFWRIRHETPGPVFFRQSRLGMNMREFTVLKFRTMRMGDNDSAHRRHILRSADQLNARPEGNGLYKLERSDIITPSGRWLRKTSLDELPQLINVLRGEMSLVGPRPCLQYELEVFKPYHYDRFHVPPGLTGLWQVTARAHATIEEALDMDVAYARDWSLWLDFWLICRTPFAVLRQREATA